MQFHVFFALSCTLQGVVAMSDQQRSVAAVQKVIQMLSDMTLKAKEEKKNEEVAFAEFGTWCTGEQANLKTSIQKGAESVELFSSEIAKLTSESKALGGAIAKLASDVADFEADIKSSAAQRSKDYAAFLDESTDYGESVDALDRAIVVLQKQEYDRPASKSALLQLSESTQLPEKAKAMVSAFIGMMQDDEPSEYTAPEANAYEFQSGGIIGLLKKLKDEFSEKLADCQKEEMNSKHACDMKIQDLKDSIENSKKDIESKTIEKATKMETIAADKKELASAQACKAEDESTLKDVSVECEEKKLSFDEKQKLRSEEIAALQEAIKVLSSKEVQTGEQYLNMAQKPKVASAFTILRGTHEATEENEGIRRRIREFLAAEALRLHSSDLSLLAQKVAADPFAKVKKMIDDMITRLLEEAHADADHEGFCDKEVGKSKVTRAKLSEDIDGLTAAVEEGKATILRLTEEVATLSKEVAELSASMIEATKMRTAEKARNKVTVEDAAAAEEAVSAAIAILKKFYEGASVATALLQAKQDRPAMGSDEWNSLANPNFEGTVDKGHKEGMQTFGKTYQGQQDEAGGVLAMLEVISADFASVQADTKAEESAAQETYDTFMTEGKKKQGDEGKANRDGRCGQGCS